MCRDTLNSMFMKKFLYLGVVIASLHFTGCTKTESGLVGCGLGTAAGAGIGYAIDGGTGGAVLGGVLGAIGGGAIGSMVHKEEEETYSNEAPVNKQPELRQQIRQEQYNVEQEKIDWRKQELENKRLEIEKKRLELQEKELQRQQLELELKLREHK